MESKQSASKAVSDFSKKLKAFVASGSADPQFKSENASLQEVIHEREALRVSNIISYYKKFTTPDADIAEDQANLLKAYALFKGLRELNRTSGDEYTFIKSGELVSPLSRKARYTTGGDFIYLTAWFIFEKNIQDFAPLLEEGDSTGGGSAGSISPSGTSGSSVRTASTGHWSNDGITSPVLTFVPAQKRAFSIHDREVLGIIKSEFYRTGTS